MQRLAALDHDVVRHVDDRLNRPEPGAPQSLAHPQWCPRVGLEPAQHAARESRTARARTERNRKGFADRGGDGRRIAVREVHVAPSGELTCDTDHAEAVAAVRRDVDLEHGVVEAQVLGERSTFGRVGIEKQQAVDVVDQLELLGRAQHAVRLHAAQLSSADALAVRQLGADAGERRFDAGRHIRRAAHDLMLAGAVIDEANGQAIRVRMAVDAHNLGHDDPCVGHRERLDRIDFEPRGREIRRDALGVSAKLEPVAQPIDVDPHAYASAELLEEPQIVLEERAQVVDAVAKHRQPLDAHPECVAIELDRIDADIAQHVGMHHSAAQDLEPTAGLRSARRPRPTVP